MKSMLAIFICCMNLLFSAAYAGTDDGVKLSPVITVGDMKAVGFGKECKTGDDKDLCKTTDSAADTYCKQVYNTRLPTMYELVRTLDPEDISSTQTASFSIGTNCFSWDDKQDDSFYYRSNPWDGHSPGLQLWSDSEASGYRCFLSIGGSESSSGKTIQLFRDTTVYDSDVQFQCLVK